MLRQQAGMTRRGSVLIAASFRSYTREVVEAAELAHTQGAAVIAITDQAVSPLAKFARVTLLVGDDPTVQFRSLVAPLCAAQALVMALRLRDCGAQREEGATWREKNAPRGLDIRGE
jgi:DNA-binding MurR/RpiR family transcriptional regulator